ncbi:MAG: hypothetical protein R2857_12805 [Vampirovibrionales bacterium]
MNTFNWLQLEQMGASARLLLVALGTLMYVLHRAAAQALAAFGSHHHPQGWRPSA